MDKGTLAAALAAAGLLTLAACGGGGGSGTPVTTAVTPATPSTPNVPAQTPVTFANVSVHDPSVINVDGTFYIFGSHLAAAKSTDLMNWTKIADGATASNPLFADVTKQLAETFAWAQTTTLWAPDVIRLDDGKYYFYYNACKGDSPRSALGVAVADKVDGPYVNKQIILKSGMWGEAGADGTIYDATKHPNVVDPNVFRDKDNKLWMICGSYSGGIFILAMDPKTGLPLSGQGYGKHLLGGNHARIEGAYVQYNAQTGYYYMFTSFGGLDANGAYNVRVARSRNPDGPYVDAKGTDMATVKADPTKPLFDDASIAPHGQKLMGNHQFAVAAGETGAAPGYVSPGHNSTYYDPVAKKYFIIFHTRFPGTGELHEVRVHEMFFNEDGWPVIAPLRYVPLTKSATALAAAIPQGDAAGTYKLVDHGKDISAAIKASQVVTLAADGKVSGAVTGTWTHKGENRIALTLNGAAVYNGVLSRQWNPNANAFSVTFSAQNADGVSLWAIRTGN
ncbi:arabinan endo-1,5-alpha-L-arabinosidase [Pseudoduganella flava]|uniref:Arabinan endo-1,5-alpha-L-arabinosidase n=1 Tax=Pseudoduganella flava TaxID=871742 RepID=A0A562Q0N9_9BURK|nr:glycoside hydrolase family 43 protein [Pseudoduganella flava]QGZ38552.1 family 43 glycosylhydrolase [Pseudoduganella flava]TWI49886.1 arabinan endo-1,5-alpha-L-arabinosidase [Pseudoduganella flava]